MREGQAYLSCARIKRLLIVQADLESMSQQRSDSDAAGAELMGHLEEAETRTLAAEKAAQAASEEAAAAKQRLEDLQVQTGHLPQAAVKSAVCKMLHNASVFENAVFADTHVIRITWHASLHLMSITTQAFLHLKYHL